jgi:hypothetical protein
MANSTYMGVILCGRPTSNDEHLQPVNKAVARIQGMPHRLPLNSRAGGPEVLATEEMVLVDVHVRTCVNADIGIVPSDSRRCRCPCGCGQSCRPHVYTVDSIPCGEMAGLRGT